MNDNYVFFIWINITDFEYDPYISTCKDKINNKDKRDLKIIKR